MNSNKKYFQPLVVLKTNGWNKNTKRSERGATAPDRNGQNTLKQNHSKHDVHKILHVKC